ncbi:N-acetylneuraminate lyase [Paenibacillus flagellatus]|uniref:N-acetylneuraminate lyase n=2 Tax=Paenibacillus flagellatus TaxID=2211139 RepID=A0A2V5KD50_9BACL|nr:N-acetylneuraminate lyase [Paenibacillus flagellatus]
MTTSRHNEKFKGMMTALLTPMDERGTVDAESLRRLVRHQLDRGIRRFYVGGSTGEAFLLTVEERMGVLETVVEEAAGEQAAIVAHVGCIGTSDSVRLARHAERAGADAVSAVVPFYYKASMKQIRDHYETIMAATPLPMIVYHFPGATGVQLSLDFYEDMASRPSCIGVKFTSLNLFELQQIRARCGDDFLIWNGHDEVFAGGGLMGADGAIGSTFNMMPDLFASFYRDMAGGDWSSVREAQTEANAVIAHMLRYDVIPYEKLVLYLQGVIATPTVRRPLTQFTPEERRAIEAFYAQSGTLRRSAAGREERSPA